MSYQNSIMKKTKNKKGTYTVYIDELTKYNGLLSELDEMLNGDDSKHDELQDNLAKEYAKEFENKA